MNKINFSLELKKRIPPADWAWLLLSLRQDESVWTSLEETELGAQALDQFTARAEAWSPAALSLLALETLPTLDELRSTPFAPLNKELLSHASQVYEGWVKKPQAPVDLSSAGLLALIFREQFRLNSSWQETLSAAPVEIATSRTMLSCLYGMLPEPRGLLATLCGYGKPEWVSLAVHTLLSNPIPPESQWIAFSDLMAEMPPSTSIAMIQALNSLRPQMAARLARQILGNPLVGRGMVAVGPQGHAGIEHLEQLIYTLQVAQMHQIAGQADLAVPALSDSLRMIRRMRGHLSAQLATYVVQTKDLTTTGLSDAPRNTSVEAWKQAVHLTPDEPRYAAGYAKALMSGGRLQDAFVFLKSYIEEETHPSHPELLLTYTSVLDQLDQQESAQKATSNALKMVLAGTRVSEHDMVSLILLLIRGGDLSQSLGAVQAGLAAYPSNRDLLALSAKIYSMLGDPERAITSAYATQASVLYQAGCGDQTIVEPDLFEEASCSTESDRISSLDLQRLLVESLEATNAWESAYNERLVLMEAQEHPSADDLKALATDAVGAQKYADAIDICRKILRKNPVDLWAHRQLAEICGSHP